MASLFDPSAFIEAERSQTVASDSYRSADVGCDPKMADFRQFSVVQQPTVATLATIAAGHGENLPWSTELESWAASTCPSDIRADVWDEVTHEALAVSRTWGAKALAAGWTSLQLFGCYRRPQYRRRDHNGLVATIVGLLSPVRITALDADYAELTDHNGSIMRFRRRDKPGAVHLWEAYTMSGGP